MLRIIDARRALILQVAVATLLLTAAILFLWPARYSASAVVMLEPRKNNVTDLSAVLSPTPTDPPRYKIKFRF